MKNERRIGMLDRTGLLIVGAAASALYYAFEHTLHTNDLAIAITIAIIIIISFLTQVLVNDINNSRRKLKIANENLEQTVRERTAELRNSELKYRTIFENTGTATVIFDNHLRTSLANSRFLDLAAYGRSDVENRRPWIDFVDEKNRVKWRERIEEAFDETAAQPRRPYECRFVDQYEIERDVLLTIAPIPETDTRVASLTDITDLKQAERRIYFQAFHDALTGLPNRALFMEHLIMAMKRARQSGGRFAVIYLDIDRFKLINDSLGHGAGDRLLVSFAERIRNSLRDADILARLGGDEFAILLEDSKAPDYAVAIANDLQYSLRKPFGIHGKEVFAPASFGVVVETQGYDQPEAIVRDADAAMYHAKENGRSQVKVFDKTLHEKAIRLLQQETDLRKAVHHRQFENYYQPIVRLDTATIVGLEALVRWQHPETGLVDPGAFIPTAEDTGLIVPITRLIIAQACRDLREWQKTLPAGRDLTLNVNISCKHFQQPSLLEDFREVLRETGLPPCFLNLEITETALMDDADENVRLAHRLRDLGFGLVIDDFGTGYSSLSYLQRLPIGTLKIDRSFIAKIHDKPGSNRNIVEAIISLAHKLNMKVVAEGIETEDQQTILSGLRCEYGQGYLFAPPLPKSKIDALLGAFPAGVPAPETPYAPASRPAPKAEKPLEAFRCA
jgi:diguanylate cyclase (GGDEF)-like protein/PAS domain S-box-containing protein